MSCIWRSRNTWGKCANLVLALGASRNLKCQGWLFGCDVETQQPLPPVRRRFKLFCPPIVLCPRPVPFPATIFLFLAWKYTPSLFWTASLTSTQSICGVVWVFLAKFQATHCSALTSHLNQGLAKLTLNCQN